MAVAHVPRLVDGGPLGVGIYWLMFAMPCLGILLFTRRFKGVSRVLWAATGLTFLILVGLREQVGWDWFNYVAHYNRVYLGGLSEALTISDPGYGIVTWVGAKFDLGVYFVNFVCAAILLFGMMAFARRQPDPWLSLLVAVPYAIIVVGMGYTRQSAAIGFEFLALNALFDRRLVRYVGFILMAALFHKTAIVLLPLALLNNDRYPAIRWIAGIIMAAGALFFSSVIDSLLDLRERYIALQITSEGATIRVALNAVPAALFLLLRRFIPVRPSEARVVLVLALGSIACIPMAPIFSTATDRLALYLIPIQLLVWGRIALVFKNREFNFLTRVGVIGVYAATQFVWLTYATHAAGWLPYRNLLFETH